MIRRKFWSLAKDSLLAGRGLWLLSKLAANLGPPLGFLRQRPLNPPLFITLLVTPRCNLNCGMCNIPKNTSGDTEMVTPEFMELIQQMAALGVAAVGFSGGEPLLRKDIFDLIAVAKVKGMIAHLNTNGVFIDSPTAQELLHVGLDSINVSLEGGADIHDLIRGKIGVFNQTIKGLKILREKRGGSGKPLINLLATLGPSNAAEVFNLISLTNELKLDGLGFIPMHRVPVTPPEDWDEAARTALYALPHLARQTSCLDNTPSYLSLFPRHFQGLPAPAPCLAPYYSLVIDYCGRAAPCILRWEEQHYIADLRRTSLKQIWRSPELQAIRNQTALCRRCYWNCTTEMNLMYQRLLPFWVKY